MKTLAIHEFCHLNNVPESFLDQLADFRLIQLIEVDTRKYILEGELNKIMRFANLRYELNINLEGIDVINNLLQQIDELQEKIYTLQNKIDFYE